MSVLSIESLDVSYGNNVVIKNFCLNVKQGEVLALFGPSGSGKSTVLKAVTGLLEQATGTVKINDEPVLTPSISVPPYQRGIGLIFQDYALFPHLTVWQNIAFGIADLSKKEQIQRVNELLKLIHLPNEAQKYPHQLSGGQQQRVAIARALATKPKIMLFDESFSNIDPQFRFELISDIRKILKQQNIAGLFVTHNQDEAFAFCDRIAVLNEGKVEQIAKAQDLFNQPATPFIAEFLGHGIWLECTVESATSLQSPLGKIIYAGQELLTPTQLVKAYVRPHQLKLIIDETSEQFVKNERFVGEFFESEVEWNNQSTKVKTRHSFVGQPIRLGVDTHIEKVFPV